MNTNITIAEPSRTSVTFVLEGLEIVIAIRDSKLRVETDSPMLIEPGAANLILLSPKQSVKPQAMRKWTRGAKQGGQMLSRPETGMTRRQIIRELKRLGWKKNRHGWASPRHKRQFQQCDLRTAASLECLLAREDL